MKNLKLVNWSLTIFYVINLLMFLSKETYWSLEKKNIYINILMLIGILFMYCCTYQWRVKIRYVWGITFFAGFLIYGILTYIPKNSLHGYLTLLLGILAYSIATNISMEIKYLKFIYGIIVIMGILWIVRLENYYDKFMLSFYDLGQKNTLNSNTVGMIVLTLMLFACIFIEVFYKKKWLQNTICIIGIWGIWNTASRGTLIAALVFFFLITVVPRKFISKYWVMQILYFFIFWGGIIFPFIYVLSSKKILKNALFINGKSLFSGREIIWNEAISYFQNHVFEFMIGKMEKELNIYTYLASNGSNIHSWFLYMIFSFGIIGIFLFYLFIFGHVHLVYKTKINDSKVIALLAYISIMVNGYIEYPYIFTVLHYFILAMPIILSNGKQKNMRIK